MSATTLRPTLVAAIAAALCSGALLYWKQVKLHEIGEAKRESTLKEHERYRGLFQSSFYFDYREKFLPGLRSLMETTTDLGRVQILSVDGGLLFDSLDPREPKPGEVAPAELPPEVLASLAAAEPTLYSSGFGVSVLVPTGQAAFLYRYSSEALRARMAAGLALSLVGSLAFGFGVVWALRRRRRARRLRIKLGLRAKFVLGIVLVNGVTGGIVFASLSLFQESEEKGRIQSESILFSRFATSQLVSDFSNYFYFYYQEKFLPGVRALIAANENLVSIRVISRKTRTVLFDSDLASSSSAPASLPLDSPQGALAPGMEAELAVADTSVRALERGGEPLLSVVQAYRGESREPLFYVEYRFAFQSLKRSVAATKRRLLLDLVPSMLFGFALALLFARLLISPIRRLSEALSRVAQGDYDVAIRTKSGDELGELVASFNTMAGELRKKKELRKYLSDSTYRQIMDAPEGIEKAALGGTRVQATVLFSDIRDFVGHCESLEAEEVTSMLNEYFTEMVEVIHHHGGEVDKFIGDALLAVFYDQPDPLPAIQCGLEMRERLATFNQRRIERGKRPLEIGVGITFGELISGPIGSKDRRDFTVIGDVVNLASRIEKLSKQGKYTRIVFSHHVEEKVRGLLECAPLAEQVIQGKSEEVRVFELVRIVDLASLVSNLESDEGTLRARSVQLLGTSHNLSAFGHLTRAIEDRDEKVRLEAVFALARLSELPGAPDAVELLMERLREERAEKVISALIAALGKIGRGDRLLELARFLDSPNDRIVANAVEALAVLKSPAMIDLVLPKLSSRNNRVKANAALALFAAGRLEVIDSLKPMLLHSDPLMRSSAAFAIGDLTRLASHEDLLQLWRDPTQQDVKLFLAELQQCVPMLVALLKDPDAIVKRQAVIALGKIKDKSAVLPLIDAVAPDRDTKELVRDVAEALRSIGSHRLVREVIARL